ncbi:DUF6114 domain-containing protein [Streptomyces adustus]|uniref:DUF6114 domain-containing protein n=1 Tax=Streptomyces adustus TaxID=1609272 RepID=UPI00370FCF91
MSAESSAAVPGLFARRRQQFRAWRGTRPFWAGLFVMFGGIPIMYFPYAHLHLGHLTLAMSTTAGAGSLIIGVLLVVLGFSLWYQKHVQVFAGVAAILLGLVSLPVSNFGGFIVGFLFALIGGAMAVSWAPGAPPEAEPAEEPGVGAGDSPESAVDGDDAPEAAAHEAPYGEGPVFTKDTDAAGETNDLSGTISANGANGRHSVG